MAVINYNTEDFVARTFALTGGVGVQAVFDSVGKDTFKGSLEERSQEAHSFSSGRPQDLPRPSIPLNSRRDHCISPGQSCRTTTEQSKSWRPPLPRSSLRSSRAC